MIEPSGAKDWEFKHNPNTRTPRMRVILKRPEAILFPRPIPAPFFSVKHCLIEKDLISKRLFDTEPSMKIVDSKVRHPTKTHRKNRLRQLLTTKVDRRLNN